MFFNSDKEIFRRVRKLEEEYSSMSSRYSKIETDYNKLLRDYSLAVESINKVKEEIGVLTQTIPESERSAQQSSKKTSEYRNKANAAFEEIKNTQSQIDSFLEQSNSNKELITRLSEDLHEIFNEIKSEKTHFLNLKEDILARVDNVNERLGEYEEIIKKHPNLKTELSEIEIFVNGIKDNDSKSSQLIKSITNRRIELDTLYNEILGFVTKDDNGDEIFIDGVKQELEASLEGLEKKIDNFNSGFSEFEGEVQSNVNNLLQVNSDKIKEQIQTWQENYNLLNKRIESLLPNALTAGLSHAFSQKKEEEDGAYDKHKKQFSNGIIGMIIVSLIPFSISLISIITGTQLNVIIDRAPKLAIAILPLYVPVLWLSISSSKKMNLSKRLIEEYAHKEVLSKTFEGLSQQVTDLSDESISNELKIRLLQDFIQMYSENPGKLISDYNSSDHPIMELLENSNKLEKTINRLEKIPGMSKVAELLEKKGSKKLEQAAEIVDRNIDRVIGFEHEMELNSEEQSSTA
jgi:DNA repair exonuclease SbcCD ATPase subunit